MNGPSRDKKKTERFACSTGGGAFHGGAHDAVMGALYRRGWGSKKGVDLREGCREGMQGSCPLRALPIGRQNQISGRNGQSITRVSVGISDASVESSCMERASSSAYLFGPVGIDYGDVGEFEWDREFVSAPG